jgi:hypothetical protein
VRFRTVLPRGGEGDWWREGMEKECSRWFFCTEFEIAYVQEKKVFRREKASFGKYGVRDGKEQMEDSRRQWTEDSHERIIDRDHEDGSGTFELGGVDVARYMGFTARGR